MSQELINGIISRLESREAKAIQQRAEVAHAKEVADVSKLEDEALVRERSLRLSQLMRQAYVLQQQRPGLLKRIFTSQEEVPQITTFRQVTYQDMVLPVVTKRRARAHFNVPVRIEQKGLKTPVFSTRTELHEGMSFDIGWQAGVVTRETIFTAKRATLRELPEGGSHVKIWNRVVERHSGEAEQMPVYEVDMRTGTTTSKTEGSQDDEFISLAKNTGAHALFLVNQAIELFE